MKKYTAIFTLLCLLLLTACGNNDTNKENASNNEETETITVTDANGEVTIPANVERILASNLEDSLVALDTLPIRQWAIGTTVHDYLQDSLGDVATIEWDMPLEQVIEAEPDLIIFSSPSAVPTGQLEDYQKVAPVYVFKDEDAADWRKQVEVMGTILNKEEEAEKALEAYDAEAKLASEEIKAAIGDESVAAIWLIGGQYYFLENGRFSANVLYKDLGLTQPQFVQNMEAATDATWSPISLEGLADLDADHIFLIAAEGETGVEALTSSTLWKGLPAAQNEHIYLIKDDGSWTINGMIASEKVIETVKETLVK